MSHYTVLCITAGHPDDELDDLLAPYDENIAVAPYFDSAGEVKADRWPWSFAIKEEAGVDIHDPDAMAAWWNARRPEEESERYLVRDGVLGTMSTYNPSSKWDWYAIGGRWNGALISIFDGAKCNALKRERLDITGMRAAAMERAAFEWERMDAVFADLPVAESWESVCARLPINEAREFYWAQERCVAGKLLDAGIFGTPVEDYQNNTRDQYIEQARLGAVPGFALCTRDGWMEKGKMGWFGMSSETPESSEEYLVAANRIIEALPADYWLTMVDAHI